ncbi:MAG: hypothetical protein A3G38_01220 [Omnitrophica WOR_2 bacterium RIFCSPLOWO2_12_FULL_51_8]|nr:MAG: hypothetical protein A3G38_01220 [Omnitrophica WOR_2 bacterium RIFCSPLOWO2_12_FULL_51_8]
MGYAVAIDRAWEEVLKLKPPSAAAVRFLADEYTVEPAAKQVLSLACNIPAKDFNAILILHYLARKLSGLPELTGEWLTFRELSGVEGYAEAFRRRCIEPLIRKYGRQPAGIFTALERLPGKKVTGADAAIIVDAFAQVPALVKVWAQDEEFKADANIYFDRSIQKIFCTEDIVVLAGMIAASL